MDNFLQIAPPLCSWEYFLLLMRTSIHFINKIKQFDCHNTKYVIAFDLYVWKTLDQALDAAHMYIKSDRLFSVQDPNLTYQQVKTI